MASNNGVSAAKRRRVMHANGLKCAKCGLVGVEKKHVSAKRNVCYTFPTSEDGVWLSIDHIFPRSRGGSSDVENLRVLCTTCNTRKGVKIEAADVTEAAAVEEHW